MHGVEEVDFWYVTGLPTNQNSKPPSVSLQTLADLMAEANIYITTS
jgi:hypothetical protein